MTEKMRLAKDDCIAKLERAMCMIDEIIICESRATEKQVIDSDNTLRTIYVSELDTIVENEETLIAIENLYEHIDMLEEITDMIVNLEN